MVATHSQNRRTSGGSMGNTTAGRSRRRSSFRRQSEKISNAIIPLTSTTAPIPTTTISTPSSRSHHGKRSRSVSATESHRHTQQQQQNRRPSAPAVVEMPRLSIADRFMNANFPTTSPVPPLPQQHQQQKPASPSLSATTSFALSNSASSDLPTTGSSSRLSVADRFMNNTSSPTNSTLSISGIQQYRERSTASFSGRNTRSSSITANNNTSNEPVPGRLTIASAFMKSSSTLTPTINDDLKSRSASLGDLDLSVINGNIKSKCSKSSPVSSTNQQIHPLEEPQPRSTLFDDTQFLNLDLLISSPSATSSVLNNNNNSNGRNNSRPWGSQDTLVHLSQQLQHQQERKKPIYAQFIESEKNATLQSDNRSFTLSYNNYLLDSPDNNDKRTITMSDDLSTKHGYYEDYDDIEIDGGYDKRNNNSSKYYDQDNNNRQWSYDDEESRYYYDREESNNTSPAVSTTKLKKHLDTTAAAADDSNHTTTRGFWVGCCFVSCGQRPSRKTIEKHQKQRREKESAEADAKPKNRGFGRRGWVFCTFLSLLLIILITFFLWPRTPLMRIEGASLTSPAKITETRQGLMVGNVAFESEWLVNITVDNRQNHVPTRLVQVQVLAKDALTGLVIGKGLHNDDPNPEHIVLAPNTISTIQLPIHVDYQARDSTDTTFLDITKACSPQKPVTSSSNSPNNSRESLPLHFWITLHFFGLDWLNYKPTVIATPATGGFACPQS